MITTRHLFIGGPNDGERVLVSGNNPTIPTMGKDGRVQFYRRSLFGSATNRFEVFIHEDTDPEDVVGMLIEHYRP